MTRYESPLTQEQSDFAAKHADLINQYLRIRHLPEDEYYDVVVFGYLRAVRRYLTIPELREYKFSTIAFQAMRTELFDHFRAQRTAMRHATVLMYDEERHNANLEDPVAMQVEQDESLAETRQKLSRCLSPSQSKIIYLQASGYSVSDVAKAHGIRPKDLKAELEAVRENMIYFAPELLKRVA